MANEKKDAVAAPGAPAVNPNSFAERLKMSVNVSDASITGTFRGAKLDTKAALADFEKLTVGLPNSSIRKGEIFKVLKPGIITQNIGGQDRKLPILYIENAKKEQRAIYASGIMRSVPTRSTTTNEYKSDVIDFNRGLLQDSIGLSFPQVFEKLVGDGEQYLHVTDLVSWQTTAFRRDEVTGQPSTDEKDKFTSNQTAYQLEFITPEQADTMSKA